MPVYVAVIVAVPEALSVTDWLGPLFTVYVTTALGVPVKVTVADWPEHIAVFDEMVAVGGWITVMVTVPVCGWLQLGVPAVAALTSAYTVVDVYACVMVAVPDASSTMVWLGPLFTVYVTTAFGVPVKVTVADWPEHIVALAEIVSVGGGMTVITTEPATGCEQLGVPLEETDTKAKVVVAVYVLVTVAVPEALSTMVWSGPPLIV